LLCREWYFVLTERKPVLGIPEGPYLEKASDEMIEAFRATCAKLAAAGYTVKSVAVMADFQALYDRHYLIAAAEAAQVHAAWFARYEELYHQRTADLIRRGQQVTQTELEEARAGQEALRHELTMAMNQEGIDLWLSPAALGPAPEGLDRTGDPVMNLPWTHSGLPTLNLPMARNSVGLPLGLQVAGRWYADEALLEWALELETVIGY
jgi:Asp-tRNA(Asn)/Glu-tRNA(Gln) amidotransferase A subunit family amidase